MKTYCLMPHGLSAEAMLQALKMESAEGKKISLQSKEGAGPGTDPAAWQALFAAAQ